MESETAKVGESLTVEGFEGWPSHLDSFTGEP